MREHSWMRLGAGLALALLCGCEGGSGGGRGDGELGFATFRWECAGPGDLACITERVESFPRGVALGSTFELSYTLHGHVPVDAGWIEQVGSTHAQELSSSGNYEGDYDYGVEIEPRASYLAQAAGDLTLLALAQDDTVADFITLSIEPVTSLALVRDCRSRSCSGESDGDAVGAVLMGSTIDVRAEPFGGGTRLVGDIDYAWESLTPEIAALVQTDGNVATLELLAPGIAYLRVQGVDLEDTVAIEVTSNVMSEGPHRRPPSGETEGGSTDGTGTESGTSGGTDTDPGTGTSTGTGTTGGM